MRNPDKKIPMSILTCVVWYICTYASRYNEYVSDAASGCKYDEYSHVRGAASTETWNINAFQAGQLQLSSLSPHPRDVASA